ncbi:MAG: metal-dependent hydrolase [Candidatus Micrarchaeota archaeon]|nr:metal-dependent hydrolase [Candidatus Micrarchaeota archaeon]MCX8154303.1 metal-dependent hydrolase [Candidatus Micrarchaeota archaeon]
MKIQFLGHSAVYVEASDRRILIDPWIRGNPVAKVDMNYILSIQPNYILVTHGHFDHGLEDAIDISKRTGAKLVGYVEMMQYATQKGATTIPMNIGGYIQDSNLRIHMFQSHHTCPYGTATSFVVSDGNISIFHAGDTGLTMDFQLISRKYSLNLAILPIGGRFTMRYDDVDIAKDLLGAKRYIGIHYNTFPLIKIDTEEARQYIELYDEKEEISI